MLTVTNSGGKARAELCMASNPKSDFSEENRNKKKKVNPNKLTALCCTCVQEVAGTGGLEGKTMAKQVLFTYTIRLFSTVT